MRKVLSFVLVLALVLSSFSMAFAAEAGLTDIADNANEDAIQVSYDLGIVTGNPDGTFLPDKAVNRAEFAAMITRALAIPDSALAGYTSTTFKDTAGYGWAVPYLAFCQSKGILLGDGAGNVMPGRTINTNEAMTMVLRAIGYTSNSAALVGVWPANYVTLAQEKDLYDDVTAAGNVNKANAAQIIYNALTVEKVEVATDGTTDGTGTTLIESGLDCDDVTGIIGGDLTNDGLINLQELQGVYGTAYINDDEEIVAFDAAGTSVKGDWTVDADSTLVGYLDADKDYEFSASAEEYDTNDVDLDADTEVYYYENGEADGVTSVGALVDEATYTFNADITGKTINMLYSVSTWVVDGADMAEADDVSGIEDDQELLGYEFILDDDDEINLNEFELVGVSSLDKIAEDNVVYVYANDDNEIRKIAVGTEQVTGKVTKKTVDSFYVNGTEYELVSSAAVDGCATELPATGDDVTLYLDASGDVYDYDVNDSTPDTYAVVKAFEAGTGISEDQIKLYTSEGSTKTYTVDEDASITTGDAISVDELTADGDVAVNSLIGYNLDDDGVIDAIDGTAVTGDAIELVSARVLDIDGTTYPVTTDCVVLTFDGGTSYDVVTIGDVETEVLAQTNVSVSAILDDGDVVALLVDDADAGASADDVFAVANAYDEIYDATLDDEVFNLVGFADGAAVDKNTSDDTPDGDTPATGNNAVNLYKITFDSDGYITSFDDVATDGDANTSVANGTIAAISSDKLTVQLVSAGGVWYEIAEEAVVYQIADFGTDDKEYRASSVSSLRASSDSTTYTIYLYEVDDDVDGYDVVIWYK